MRTLPDKKQPTNVILAQAEIQGSGVRGQGPEKNVIPAKAGIQNQPKNNAPAPVRLLDVGLMPYEKAWDLQRRIHQEVVNGANSALILCEHPPVISIGSQTKQGNILQSADSLRAQGFDVITTDRGGDVTYHGPGQLVGYPIFRLRDFPCGEDLHLYVRAIEQALILALAEFEIVASRVDGKTGVWVGVSAQQRDSVTPATRLSEASVMPAKAGIQFSDNSLSSQDELDSRFRGNDKQEPLLLQTRKIASIGLKCSRWVSMHGFALNVTPDMSHFNLINPCGFTANVMTSLKHLMTPPPPMDTVKSTTLRGFEEVFECRAHAR